MGKNAKTESIPIVRDEIGRIHFPGSALAMHAESLLDVLFHMDGNRLETERIGKSLIIWQVRGKIVGA